MARGFCWSSSGAILVLAVVSGGAVEAKACAERLCAEWRFPQGVQKDTLEVGLWPKDHPRYWIRRGGKANR